MKRHLTPFRVVAGCLALLVVLLLAAIFRPAPALRISKETTYVIGPLDAAGRVDYLAAVEQQYTRDLPPEENAARHYVRAFDPDTRDWPEVRDEMLRRLGLPPVEEQQLAYLQWFEHFAEVHPELIAEMQEIHQVPSDVEWESIIARLEDQEAAAIGALERQGRDAEIDALPDIPTSYDITSYWEERASQRSWTREEFPAVAAWLDDQQVPLAHLHAGAQLERCYFPLILEDDKAGLLLVAMPHTLALRSGPKTLRIRAMLQLGEGNRQAAWEDIRTALVLSKHMAEQPSLIASLVAIAMQEHALLGLAAILHHGGYTPEELHQIEIEFDRLAPLKPMAEEFDGAERLTMLSVIQSLVAEEFSREQLKQGRFPGLDWNVPFAWFNDDFNRLVAVAEMPAGDQRNQKLRELEAAIEQRNVAAKRTGGWIASVVSSRARGELMAAHLSDLLRPALPAALQAEQRNHMRVQVVHTAIALAQYRAEQGAYPASLHELAPTFLNEIPTDTFGDGPVQYQRIEEGYVLYSVGPNGQDDASRDATQDESLDYAMADDIAIHAPYPIKRPPWVRAQELLESGYFEKLVEEADEAETPDADREGIEQPEPVE